LRKFILVTIVLLIIVGITGYMNSDKAKEYYKYADDSPPEYVDYLKLNGIDVKVEKDGSLWININDRDDLLICCS
jgi:hypothetical protein